jgi:hypothetical protein
MRPVFMGDVQITEDVTFTFGTFVAPVVEDFETGLTHWVNVTGDQRDFTRQTGPTVSANTGPSGAHEGSWYVYAETSSPALTGDRYWLQTASAFTAGPSTELTFYYHMYGITIGTANIYVSTDSGLAWSSALWTLAGQQQTGTGDPYNLVTVDLSSYAGQSILVRLEYIRSTSFTGDAAFDLFTYNPRSSYDVTINAGSWFASPLHLWLYVCSQADAALGTTTTVAFDPDTLKLTITGAAVCVVPAIDDIGYSAGSQTLGLSAVLQACSPLWPLVSIDFAAENLTGKGAIAHDGTTYTIAGAVQETCQLTVSLDRAWPEWQDWFRLWQLFWLAGRYVCMYIDADDLPSTATGLISPGYALQFGGGNQTQPVHRLTRLVENKDARDLTDGLTFHVRSDNLTAWQLRT